MVYVFCKIDSLLMCQARKKLLPRIQPPWYMPAYRHLLWIGIWGRLLTNTPWKKQQLKQYFKWNFDGSQVGLLATKLTRHSWDYLRRKMDWKVKLLGSYNYWEKQRQAYTIKWRLGGGYIKTTSPDCWRGFDFQHALVEQGVVTLLGD